MSKKLIRENKFSRKFIPLSIIKSMNKKFRNLLPQSIVPKVIFTGSKLSSKFQVKERTIFSHNHDIIYQGNCPENGCSDSYVGETARRISERVLGHTGKDVNSHFHKHSHKWLTNYRKWTCRLYNRYYLPVCHDLQCDVNLVEHMSDTVFKMDLPNPKLFFPEKSDSMSEIFFSSF